MFPALAVAGTAVSGNPAQIPSVHYIMKIRVRKRCSPNDHYNDRTCMLGRSTLNPPPKIPQPTIFASSKRSEHPGMGIFLP